MRRPPTHRPGNTRRSALVVVAFFAFVGVGGYFFARQYKPHWFDSEGESATELAALKTAALAPAPPAAPDAGWPQWFGPNRDGRAPVGPLQTDWDAHPPQKVWSVPCGGGYSSVSVANDRAYVTDYQAAEGVERVVCLDAATGDTRWTYSAAADYSAMKTGYAAGPRAAPLVHAGRVYALGAAGALVCLEEPTGAGAEPRAVWAKHFVRDFGASVPTWGFASSPLLEGDTIIVQPGGKAGSVVAFDRDTGDIRWKAGTDPTGYSSPVAMTGAGVRQIIAMTGRSVFGLRPADGKVIWSAPWATQFDGNIATPVVAGDYVFLSSGYAKGCALWHLTPAGEGGVAASQVYFRKARVMQNHHSTCVTQDGFLYGFDSSLLRCVELRQGEVKEDWIARDAAGAAIQKGCLILADKHLIGLTESGTLFLADADPEEFHFRGAVRHALADPECWALPVLVDGRIYLRDKEKIVCYDARPEGK
ncbi:PQQ-binding-like beta-propeller repeat protein [Fimbriiglobus ruber]|uniref:Putative polyvinylalcohol dehydrogenase n=1 Tax=Fimbriiglobus ruber TaxID=1908690 RepID=A0A225DHV7_9BACT|nr:PQQ-binding-like beta-propeller repeat protein [Fimbriiglobus ruber]OWK35677.1 putative polyvinylalcohol dehydrogenase [Fimbriiglobus ruber]